MRWAVSAIISGSTSAEPARVKKPAGAARLDSKLGARLGLKLAERPREPEGAGNGSYSEDLDDATGDRGEAVGLALVAGPGAPARAGSLELVADP